MATLVLRPTSCSGSNWSNTSYAYDGSTSTAAKVSISSSNYSSRILTCNFNTSSIPSGATINSATLTVIAKQSSSTSSRRITPRVDINGDSNSRVINKQLTSTSSTTLTADVKNYISSLSNITITGYMTTTRSSTFSIYEVYINIDYTEPIVTYTVTFKDWDGSVLKTQTVQSGSSATAPTTNPSRNGYNFIGWDNTFDNITSDMIITAQYEAIQSPNTQIKNIILGNKTINKIFIGNTSIYKIFLGDIKLFDIN